MPTSQVGFVGLGIPAGGAAATPFTLSTKVANYTFVPEDFDGNIAIGMNLAVANTVTLNSSMAPTEPVMILQIGVGQTSIVAGAGVTIRSSIGTKLRAQYSAASLIPIGTDEYLLSGDLEL